MIAKDKAEMYDLCSLRIKKMKGHVKIILRDVRTGKIRISEGENIVTNAIPDILSNPYMSCLDATKMMPLTDKWFGGILCYHDAFETDPNNPILDAGGNPVLDGEGNPMYHPYPTDYGIQDDSVNALVGHAGDTAPSTAAIINEDLKRGSPSDIVITSNSVKRSWSFEPRQANGVISSLALTHVDTGNAGTGNTSTAFKNYNPYASLQSNALTNVDLNVVSPNNIYGQYDDNNGFWFAIGEDGDYTATGNHTGFGTNKLTFYIRRLPFAKTGLFETVNPRANFDEKFTVEFSNSYPIGSESYFLYAQPCYHFDYANKRLYIFSNAIAPMAYQAEESTYSKQYVKYAIIDCRRGISDNARVLEEGKLTSDTSNLAPIPVFINSFGYVQNAPYNQNIIYDGVYVYLPTSSTRDWYPTRFAININGFKKIKLSDSVNYDDIVFNSDLTNMGGCSKHGGLIIATGNHSDNPMGRVINNKIGYVCQGIYALVSGSYGFRTFCEPYNTSFITAGVGDVREGTMPRVILASKLVNTTKFNLKSPVTKQGTEQMTIEYTLTEE